MRKTKEQVLNECHKKVVKSYGTESINTDHFPEAFKAQAALAMGIYAEQEATDFLYWLRGRPDDLNDLPPKELFNTFLLISGFSDQIKVKT